MHKAIEFILIFLAFALIIAGTAIMWNNRGNVLFTNDLEYRNQYNWDGAVFWVLWAFAAGSIFFRQTMLATCAAGLLFAIALAFIYTPGGSQVTNLFSWAHINLCRRGDQQGTDSSTRRCTSGGILMYAGALLALFVAFSPYAWTAAPSILPRLLSIAAFFVVLAGIIVIWCADVVNTSNPAYYQSIDATVMAALSTLYMLAGVFGYNVPLRAAAGVLSAFSFVWIFHLMFIARDNTTSDGDMVYAGFILAWAGMLLNMVVCTLLFYGQAFATSRTATV